MTEGHSETLRRVRENSSSCSSVHLLSRNSINNLPSYNDCKKASYFCLSTYQFSENYMLGQINIKLREMLCQPSPSILADKLGCSDRRLMNEPPLRGYNMNQSSYLNKVLPPRPPPPHTHTTKDSLSFSESWRQKLRINVDKE